MRRHVAFAMLLVLTAGCAPPNGGSGVAPVVTQPPAIELFVVGDSFASQGGNPGTTTPGDLLVRTWWGGYTVHPAYRPLHSVAPPSAPVATPDTATVADNGGWTPRGLYADAAHLEGRGRTGSQQCTTSGSPGARHGDGRPHGRVPTPRSG